MIRRSLPHTTGVPATNPLSPSPGTTSKPSGVKMGSFWAVAAARIAAATGCSEYRSIPRRLKAKLFRGLGDPARLDSLSSR